MHTLSDVINSGMCIGCGACTAADNGISLVLDPQTLSFRPNREGNSRAAKVCPAIAVRYEDLISRRFPGKDIGPCGAINSVSLAQSNNLARNANASSGGMIKELLLHLLRTGKASGVIALTRKDDFAYEPAMLKTEQEVDSLPGSIYHAISFEKAYALLEQANGPVAIVALPCQLEGMYAYLYQQRPDLLGKIAMTIGLMCGWQYSLHAIKALCSYEKLPYGDLAGISYRGGDRVGKMRLFFPGKEHAVDRKRNLHYLAAFDRSYNLPRCHLCINHINLLADVVVGDAWLQRTKHSTTGVSIVVARNEAAGETLRELESSGRIVTSPGSVDDIIASQSRNLVYGDSAYSYQAYLRKTKQPVPDLCAPNKAMAQAVEEGRTARYAREFACKRKLQHTGRYRLLLWRKLAFEFPRALARFMLKRLSSKQPLPREESLVPNIFR